MFSKTLANYVFLEFSQGSHPSTLGGDCLCSCETYNNNVWHMIFDTCSTSFLSLPAVSAFHEEEATK
jgi:hypothetical protein